MIRLIGFYDYTVILTYLSLLSSVSGMILSVRGSFTGAILCLMLSGLCDAFDGIVARSKKNRTEDEKGFGIQLDSLCDVVCFGAFPALLCYHMGMDGFVGTAIVFLYCLCAVIRLAFFNVLETKRQQTETGSNKFYRGLPVTSISIHLPVIYLAHMFLKPNAFVVVLCVTMLLTAFLFILDIRVPKFDWSKLLPKKT